MLEKQLAVFRTNATGRIGGGHVRRCLVLADALIEAGWTVMFACGPDSVRIIPGLRYRNFALIDSGRFDAAVHSSTPPVSEADLLVVDDYGLDATFETNCRSWAERILVIDDLANRNHDCDVLLDHSAGRHRDDYRRLVPRVCELLIGPSYALLDGRFYAAHRQRRPVGTVDRIMVNFGATDEANATHFVLDVLSKAKLGVAIDVVLGGSSPNLAVIQEKVARFGPAISLHIDVEDMAALMNRADVAIGAGGVGALERCALGLPSAIVTVAHNQVANAAALAAAGAALDWGRLGEFTVADMAYNLSQFCRDPARRERMRDAASALVDGLGAARVRVSCYPLLHAKDGGFVSLREARFDDCAVMLSWQSQPGVRAYARNPASPLQAEHEQWLRTKLHDPDCIFNIVLHNDEPAGILRFDRLPSVDAFEVSILIAPERQGLGLGSRALELGKRMLQKTRIVAVIHPENRISARMFEHAGYRQATSGEWVLEPTA